MDRATAQQVNQPGTGLAALRAQLRAATLRPEADASGELLADLSVARAALERAATRAARWVETARADQRSRPLVDRMLEQFPLDSAQGKALMGLAEALLRTPDPRRADQLISERLATVRAAGVPGNTALLLRTGFVLLGAAGRLLPDVTAQLSGEFSAASLSAPRTWASASPSMPRRPTGWTCRSISSRRWPATRRRATGTAWDWRCRPTGGARRACSSGWRRSRATAGGA